MPTGGERQNYIWRPNTNASTTLTRYDQEAQQWHRAFKNAERKNRPADYSGAIEVIRLLLSLTVALITVVVMLISRLVQWLRN